MSSALATFSVAFSVIVLRRNIAPIKIIFFISFIFKIAISPAKIAIKKICANVLLLKIYKNAVGKLPILFHISSQLIVFQ